MAKSEVVAGEESPLHAAVDRSAFGPRRPISDWRYPARVCVLFGGVVLAGVLIGWFVLPPGAWGRPSDIWSALFRWDSYWYLRIAQHGYQWSAASPRGQFDVAFFPAYPMIEATLGHLVHAWPKWMLMAPSLVFGVMSIFAFHHLARSWLPEEQARTATLGFALWPGASFVVNSYPVSLLNLCAILALLALRSRHTWRAAVWGGIGSAAGPLGAVAAVVVPIQALVDQWPKTSFHTLGGLAARLRVAALGAAIAAVAWLGILGFSLYQWVALGSPLAFVSAQGGWGGPSLLARLERALTLFPFTTTLAGYSGHAQSLRYALTEIEMVVQAAFGALALALAIWLILAQRKVARPSVTIASLAVLLSYYWFSGTLQGSSTAFRELYVAVPIFVGLGTVAGNRPGLAKALIALLSAVLCASVAAEVSGYLVV